MTHSRWWEHSSITEGTPVFVALGHNSDAEEERNVVNKSKAYFDSLIQLAIDFAAKYRPRMADPTREPGDRKMFVHLLKNGFGDFRAMRELLDNPDVRALAHLKPYVMDMQVLLRGNYDPADIDQELLYKATKEHRGFETLYGYFKQRSSDGTVKRVIGGQAHLIYTIRSHIAHGEKTRKGLDLSKRHRDQQICGAVNPVLQRIISLLLSRPETKFVTYGTLAPTGVFYRIVEKLQGTWESVKVPGRIFEHDGMKYFVWDSEASFEAQMLVSNQLPNNYAELDRIEGSEYIRTLVPVIRGSGEMAIATIYAFNQFIE